MAAALLLLTFGAVAQADNVKVFGVQAGMGSSTPGAFLPSGSGLACYSVQGGHCWDGRAWRPLFPDGPRHYAASPPAQVACRIIIEPENDCWTGKEWHRLPQGRLFGIIGGLGSPTPGAFITAPLR